MSLHKSPKLSEPLSNCNSTCPKGLLKVLNEKHSVLTPGGESGLLLLWSPIPAPACFQHPQPTRPDPVHSFHKHILSTSEIKSTHFLSTDSGQAV